MTDINILIHTQGALLMEIARNFGLVVVGAYITTQLLAFRRALNNLQYRKWDKVFLILVFGSFSALGNIIGIPTAGSMANTRIVGPIVGGLLGGPLIGLGAGIIGAIPRYFMGGFTMWPSVLANVIVGYVSGLVCEHYGGRRVDFKIAVLVALGCELILKILVLTMAKPFGAAWELESIIAIPTIIANCLATGLFVYIVRDVFSEQEKAQAQSAQHAMRVICKTSGLLHSGLNRETALAVAEIIYRETHSAAVAVTDAEKVLAFVGQGADHHAVYTPIITAATKLLLKKGETVIANDRQSVGCPNPNCPLTAVVDTPLTLNGELLGSLKLFKMNNDIISPYEVELIRGIADFLTMQLAQSKIDEQAGLLSQAEFNVLKAQVNPHFLFNSLSTIRALTRNDPEVARSLIKDLADFLRKTLNRRREMITLAEEMETVHNYIRLEKARFGERIRVEEELAPEVVDCTIPVFTIQPIVENALKHGLANKVEGGWVNIGVWLDEQSIHILVEDNGVGIEAGKLARLLADGEAPHSADGNGIGLRNVDARLRRIYGHGAGLSIDSIEQNGTRVRFCLPRTV